MRPRPRPAGLLMALAGWALILWLVLPLCILLAWSFAQGWRFPDILPQAWSLRAWQAVLSDRAGLLGSLGQTVLVAALATLLSLLAGIPAGRALGQDRFRGRAVVHLILLAPLIVPGIAVALGLHGVFIRLGLTGTLAGVVLVHLVPTLPYVTLVMAAIFARHDPAFEAQARSLGASPAQTFRHVTLPMILPGVLVAGLFAFLVSWSQYALTLVIGSGKVITLPLLLYSFAGAGRHDIAGAIAVIYVLPGALVLIVTARRLTGRNPALAALGRP